MTEQDAIIRLKDYFKQDYSFDMNPFLKESSEIAYKALSNQQWLKETLLNIYKDPTATKFSAFYERLIMIYVMPDLIKKAVDDNKFDRVNIITADELMDLLKIGGE